MVNPHLPHTVEVPKSPLGSEGDNGPPEPFVSPGRPLIPRGNNGAVDQSGFAHASHGLSSVSAIQNQTVFPDTSNDLSLAPTIQNQFGLGPTADSLLKTSSIRNQLSFSPTGSGLLNASSIHNPFSFSPATNSVLNTSVVWDQYNLNVGNVVSNTSTVQNQFGLSHICNAVSNGSPVQNQYSLAYTGNLFSDASVLQNSSSTPAANNAPVPYISPYAPIQGISFPPLYPPTNTRNGAQIETVASSPSLLGVVVDRYALCNLVRQIMNSSPPYSPITPTRRAFATPGQDSLFAQKTPCPLSKRGHDQLPTHSDPDRTVSNHKWMDNEEAKTPSAARYLGRKPANCDRVLSTTESESELDSVTKKFASSNKKRHNYDTRSNKKRKRDSSPHKRDRDSSPLSSSESERSDIFFYEPAYKGRKKDYMPDTERMTPPRSSKEPGRINPKGAIPYFSFDPVKAISTAAAFPTKDRTVAPPPYTEPDAPTARPSRDDLADSRASYQTDRLGRLRADGVYTLRGNDFAASDGAAIHRLSDAAVARATTANGGPSASSEDGSFAALHPILGNLIAAELLGVRLEGHHLTVSQVGGVLRVGSQQLRRTQEAAGRLRNRPGSLPSEQEVRSALEWLGVAGLSGSLISVYTEIYDL